MVKHFSKGDRVRRVLPSEYSTNNYGIVGEIYTVVDQNENGLRVKELNPRVTASAFELVSSHTEVFVSGFLDRMETYVKAISDKHTPSREKMEARQELQRFLEGMDDGNQ